MIAEPPDATAPPTCAWCERPLARGQLRCGRCGTTTALAWPGDRALVRVPLPAVRARTGSRVCALGEAARRRVHRRLAERIARVAPPGPVLDVGSGDRLLLDALRATGRLAAGIAPPHAAPAEPRTGVEAADITELGGRYAAIVFWQSLGRLRTPGLALDHAAALLKPGGLLAIAQPSTARVQVRALGELVAAPEAPRHRVLIPPHALVERLRTLGLQVDRIDHLLDLPGGWLQSLLGGVTAIEARR